MPGPLTNFGKMQTWARAAFCAVLGLAQILAFAHVAMVDHRTCLEHGEAIHATHGRAVRSIATTDPVVATSSTLDDESHAHEHCLSMGFRRAKWLLSPPQVGLAEPQPESAARIEIADLPSATVDVLAFAPKGSPPRA